MPVITYTAVDRGFLLTSPAHTAGLSYQIENAFSEFPETLDARGNFSETKDGTPEAHLYALLQEWRITTDLIYAAAVPAWREFFSSVLVKETFQVDFTGTIASPGTDVDVILVETRIPRNQLRGDNARYTFTVRAT